MAAHSRPDGRLIHPECPRLDDSAFDCECDALHYYCETDAEFDRAADIAARLDSRTVASNKGHGPDVDDETQVTRYADGNATALGEFDGGFWKHSEFLACNQGRPMRNLSNYGTGTTWQRAREAIAGEGR